MAFWGCALKAGQKKPVSLSADDVLHLSQICLHDPKPGKNFLQVSVGKDVYSIACLEVGKREHDCVDLFFDSSDTTFVNKGSSEIHLMGYIEPQGFGDGEGEESEEVAAPQKSALKLSPKVAAASSPKVAAASSPKVAAASSPKVTAAAAQKAAAKAPPADEEEYSMFEDEESEEEPAAPPAKAQASPKAAAVKAASPKASPKAAPAAKAAAKPEADEDSYEFEGEEEEGSMIFDEEEEEEEVKLPPKAAADLQKRKAPAPAEQAPAAKKGKSEAAQAASPKASPKASNDGGGDKADYVKKLHAYLKANGKQSTGLLGSKVPRPQGVPKLKQILTENSDKFSVVGDMITAK